MKINKEFIEEIKSKLDIITALNLYTDADTSTIGNHSRRNILCPFHSEKSPSFQVDTIKNTWKCFGGCGYGDVINLYAIANDISVPYAVMLLGKELGLVDRSGVKSEEDKQRFIEKKQAAEIVRLNKKSDDMAYDELCDIHKKMEDIIQKTSSLEELERISFIVDGELFINNMIDSLLLRNGDEEFQNAKKDIRGVVHKWKKLLNLQILEQKK